MLENLQARLASPVSAAYVKLDFVRAAIADVSKLRASLEGVTVLEKAEIDRVVHSVPEAFLPIAQRQSVADFLTQRQAGLRQLFHDGRGFFPNLGQGDL